MPIHLTHWGLVTHICASKLTNTGSDNGLSPGRHQAIIWTNAEILSIGPLGTNPSEITIKIHTFSFRKMHLKMSSGKWRPSYLVLNVLITFLVVQWATWQPAILMVTRMTIVFGKYTIVPSTRRTPPHLVWLNNNRDFLFGTFFVW